MYDGVQSGEISLKSPDLAAHVERGAHRPDQACRLGRVRRPPGGHPGSGADGGTTSSARSASSSSVSARRDPRLRRVLESQTKRAARFLSSGDGYAPRRSRRSCRPSPGQPLLPREHVGRGQRSIPRRARVRSAGDDEQRVRRHAGQARLSRSPATRRSPTPRRSSVRPSCLFRPTSRTASPMIRPAPPTPSRRRWRSGSRAARSKTSPAICEPDLRRRACDPARRSRGRGRPQRRRLRAQGESREPSPRHRRFADTITRLQRYRGGADVVYAPSLT